MENSNCARKLNRLESTEKVSACLLGQEILDSFQDTEFWYAEQGSMSSNSNHSGSFRRVVHHKEEKWWLPVPCVPAEGLSESSRKHLQQKRDCANQIHKAAMAINSSVLDEMDIPHSYMASLPKVSFSLKKHQQQRMVDLVVKFNSFWMTWFQKMGSVFQFSREDMDEYSM